MLIGFPLVDMKVTLYDGAFHEVDSTAIAFEIASPAAMKEGCDKAGIKILEPIMDVEVVTPGDFVGGIIGDINSRRGQIRDARNARQRDGHSGQRSAREYVRLCEPVALACRRDASYTMQFAHYAEVPRNVADDVKKEVRLNGSALEFQMHARRASPLGCE